MTQDDHKRARSPLEWKALQAVTFPKGSPADQKRNKLICQARDNLFLGPTAMTLDIYDVLNRVTL